MGDAMRRVSMACTRWGTDWTLGECGGLADGEVGTLRVLAKAPIPAFGLQSNASNGKSGDMDTCSVSRAGLSGSRLASR